LWVNRDVWLTAHHFRSTANNGHDQTGPVGPVGAINGKCLGVDLAPPGDEDGNDTLNCELRLTAISRYASLAASHRLYDVAGAFDKALDQRAQRAILKRKDAYRPRSRRQVEWECLQ
jgi:hypothetical protein